MVLLMVPLLALGVTPFCCVLQLVCWCVNIFELEACTDFDEF